MTWSPRASIVRAPVGSVPGAVTATIVSPAIATSAGTTPSGLTTRPPAIRMSTRRLDHPAAVDGQVLPRDLARHVAGEEQDRVGDVPVGGHAAQRIVLRVALARLFDRDAVPSRHLGADAL